MCTLTTRQHLFWERNIYNYSSGGGVVPLMFYPKDTAIT
jgi:hypothetical protein